MSFSPSLHSRPSAQSPALLHQWPGCQHQNYLQCWSAALSNIFPSYQGMHLASLRNHTDSLYHLFSSREDFPETIKVYLLAIRHIHVDTSHSCCSKNVLSIQSAAHSSSTVDPEGNPMQPVKFSSS